ncbi:MAG: hypothetical protein SH850_29100 [Planctomycetaceae bacterium]|nr:hypothetical protein [Planctomycetaceae bacterium]
MATPTKRSKKTAKKPPAKSPALADLQRAHRQILGKLETILEECSAPSRVPFCIFVSTLAHPEVGVIKPIPVTIEPEADGSFVASFVDAGISSGGDSVREATWSLGQMLASSFQTLRELNDGQLGPKMRRVKAVLLEFLCPSPNPTPSTRPKN